MPLHANPTGQAFWLKRYQDKPLAFYFAVAPGSLAGRTFRFRLKATRGEAVTALIDEALTVLDTNPDADETMAEVDLDVDDWDLSEGLYYFDVRCTAPVGDRAVYAHGTITIESSASH